MPDNQDTTTTESGQAATPAEDAALGYAKQVALRPGASRLPSPYEAYSAGWDACAADPLHAAAPQLLAALVNTANSLEALLASVRDVMPKAMLREGEWHILGILRDARTAIAAAWPPVQVVEGHITHQECGCPIGKPCSCGEAPDA